MTHETKKTLLRVTREQIDTLGVEAVSMREIGKKANLSRSAVYRHFDSKQDLLAAIVREDFDLFLSGILEIIVHSTNRKQLLINVMVSYYQFAIEHPEHYQLMFNTTWDSIKHPEIKESAGRVFMLAEEYVGSALDAGNRSGLEAKEATAMLYAFIHGLVELHLAAHTEAEKGLDDPAKLIDRFVNTMFQ